MDENSERERGDASSFPLRLDASRKLEKFVSRDGRNFLPLEKLDSADSSRTGQFYLRLGRIYLGE